MAGGGGDGARTCCAAEILQITFATAATAAAVIRWASRRRDQELGERTSWRAREDGRRAQRLGVHRAAEAALDIGVALGGEV